MKCHKTYSNQLAINLIYQSILIDTDCHHLQFHGYVSQTIHLMAANNNNSNNNNNNNNNYNYNYNNYQL